MQRRAYIFLVPRVNCSCVPWAAHNRVITLRNLTLDIVLIMAYTGIPKCGFHMMHTSLCATHFFLLAFIVLIPQPFVIPPHIEGKLARVWHHYLAGRDTKVGCVLHIALCFLSRLRLNDSHYYLGAARPTYKVGAFRPPERYLYQLPSFRLCAATKTVRVYIGVEEV